MRTFPGIPDRRPDRLRWSQTLPSSSWTSPLGVDPEARRRFWQEIYDLKGAGKTLIVSTHNLDEVDYADRMIMIHRGRLMLEGEPAELLSRSGYGTIDELFQKTIADHEKNESRDR